MCTTRSNQVPMNSLVNSFHYSNLFWMLLIPKKNTELVHVSVWETGWDLSFTSTINLSRLDFHFCVHRNCSLGERCHNTLNCVWDETQTPCFSLFYLSLCQEVRENYFSILKCRGMLLWSRGLLFDNHTAHSASSIDAV